MSPAWPNRPTWHSPRRAFPPSEPPAAPRTARADARRAAADDHDDRVGIVLLATSSGSVPAIVLGRAGADVLHQRDHRLHPRQSIFVGKGASLVRVQNDFVSSVSHELRTPLTSIHLLIESLRDGRLEDAERAQVLSLLGARDRAARGAGRPRARAVAPAVELRLRARARSTSRRSSTRRSRRSTRSRCPGRRRSRRDVEPGLTVAGDRPTLVRALVNLLTNAWKYTGDDKQIAIDAQRRPAAGSRSRCATTASASTRAEQRAIFEQFQRGRAADESGAPGRRPRPVVRARDRARPPRQARLRVAAGRDRRSGSGSSAGASAITVAQPRGAARLRVVTGADPDRRGRRRDRDRARRSTSSSPAARPRSRATATRRSRQAERRGLRADPARHQPAEARTGSRCSPRCAPPTTSSR